MTEPKGLLLLFLPFTVLTNNKLAEREESIVPQIRLSLTHFVNCPLAQPLQCQIKSQNLLHLPRVFNTPVRYDWFSDSPPMRLLAKAKISTSVSSRECHLTFEGRHRHHDCFEQHLQLLSQLEASAWPLLREPPQSWPERPSAEEP